jgi:hypothetical protein
MMIRISARGRCHRSARVDALDRPAAEWHVVVNACQFREDRIKASDRAARQRLIERARRTEDRVALRHL